MSSLAPSTLLLGIAVESTIWGGYVNVLLFALVLCYRRGVNKRSTRPVLAMSAMLLLACTAHLMCGINAIWGATNVSVRAISETPGDAVVPLCNMLGLAMLVDRCWMLWGKQNWVVFPSSAAALLGFLLTTRFTYIPAEPDAIVNSVLCILGHTFLLYSNLSTTPLIAAGLDRLSHRLSLTDHKKSASLLSAPAVIIECGLLHLVVQTVQFLFILLDHPLRYAVSAAAVQIYGLSSALAVLRTGLNDAFPDIAVEGIMSQDDGVEEVDQAILKAFYCETSSL